MIIGGIGNAIEKVPAVSRRPAREPVASEQPRHPEAESEDCGREAGEAVDGERRH